MIPKEEQVIQLLDTVKHPETGKTIVEMGMVQSIAVSEDRVDFKLVIQKKKDPFINSIARVCERVIMSELGDQIKVNAEVVSNYTSSSTEKEEKVVLPGVKNIIAVASGKGGVGKSTMAVNLAVAMAQTGASVGLIDADVYGPSVPKMFGVEHLRPHVKKVENKDLIVPIEKYGVKMLSVGFFVNPAEALVWRGPMATSALRQLIHDADWGTLDYLFLDLPPGTGDVHLTIVQELPVTGAVIVSTPQEVALADAIKGISMFESSMINVPVLGLIENMSWFTPRELPDNRYYIFGKEGCRHLAEKMNLPLLGQIPIVQGVAESGDEGMPVVLKEEEITGNAFRLLLQNFTDALDKRMKEKEPTRRVIINNK